MKIYVAIIYGGDMEHDGMNVFSSMQRARAFLQEHLESEVIIKDLDNEEPVHDDCIDDSTGVCK